MKLNRIAGTTGEIWQIFIEDTTSASGDGLPALVFNSAGLTAYFHRDTDTTPTAITLVTMTLGTFTSGGFKKIDDTNMPGWYQFCTPNAAIASGAKSCGFHLKGATDMKPLRIEVDLAGSVASALSVGAVVNPVDLTATYDAAITAAQPGDAMTLTSAYDAAKTAAQPGNQMDLVNAPNSTAITAFVTAIFAKTYEGSRTFAGFLRLAASALFNKGTKTGTTQTYRDEADTKDRISVTASGGTRSASTLDDT